MKSLCQVHSIIKVQVEIVFNTNHMVVMTVKIFDTLKGHLWKVMAINECSYLSFAFLVNYLCHEIDHRHSLHT